LSWDYRKGIIIDEIRARSPDLVCLQEIDQESFNESFRPVLAEDDYKGVFFPKTRSNTMLESAQKVVDGCATFYNNSK